MAGAMVFTTSCGPKKHKIDDSTVLPFKDSRTDGVTLPSAALLANMVAAQERILVVPSVETFASLAMLAINPYRVFQSGFQLSFCAVAGICFTGSMLADITHASHLYVRDHLRARLTGKYRATGILHALAGADPGRTEAQE